MPWSADVSAFKVPAQDVLMESDFVGGLEVQGVRKSTQTAPLANESAARIFYGAGISPGFIKDGTGGGDAAVDQGRRRGSRTARVREVCKERGQCRMGSSQQIS